MDSGRFESVLKPYKFHQVMRSLFVPLRLATDARRLEFITDLDTSIDDVSFIHPDAYRIVKRMLVTNDSIFYLPSRYR